MKRIIQLPLFPFVIVALGAWKILFRYFDPNTGGMVFQLLAVAFAMVSGLIFFFSSKIKMAFGRFRRYWRSRRGEVEEEQDSENRQTIVD